MVFPTVQVSWQFVDQMVQLLWRELHDRLTPRQWSIVEPHAIAFAETFAVSAQDA
jgi:hypothetical protein